MKRYRIRQNSPIYWALVAVGVAAFLAFMSIPSTIEFL